MSRAVLTLLEPNDRAIAADWINRAPAGTRIEFKGVRRSLDQNARMWAMLTDIATQIGWHGNTLTTNEWKLLFLDALNRETKIVPSLDGSGLVNIGQSSSDLSAQEMSDLIELMLMFGAKYGVQFHDSPPLAPGQEREREAVKA